MTTSATPLRRLGTTDDAATIAGVSRRTILNWMTDEDFGYYEAKNKSEWLIDLDELEDYRTKIRSRKRLRSRQSNP